MTAQDNVEEVDIEGLLASESDQKELAEALKGESRRDRQRAAHLFSQMAHKDASSVAPYSADLVDALNRPEAQTRWECLDALTCLVDEESRLCDKALPGAEAALFDEDNGAVRLAAMRFICRLGSTTASRSEKAWPLIDEAIQCYHGDLEFFEMLDAVCAFALGKLAPEVKEALANRMKFDAVNAKGVLKRRANQIIENLS